MDTIVTRIKEYLDYKGVSINEFERVMGLSKSAFHKAIVNNASIGSDKIENFLQLYPEVSCTWLITGEGDMKRGNSNNSFLLGYLENKLKEKEEEIIKQAIIIGQQNEKIKNLEEIISKVS